MAKPVQKIGKLSIENAYDRFKARGGLPKTTIEIANDSLNHFLKGFKQGAEQGGGQTDKSKGGWKSRKNETPKTRGKGILISSGDLWKDVELLEVSTKKIEIGTRRIDYADYHNTGVEGVLPQREFLGESEELNKKNLETVEELLTKVLKR